MLEAAVRAGKRHLLSMSKGFILTQDHFRTAQTRMETIINSRPLYQKKVESSYATIDIYFPIHFLIQSNLLTPDSPEPDREAQRSAATYFTILANVLEIVPNLLTTRQNGPQRNSILYLIISFSSMSSPLFSHGRLSEL